MNKRKVDPESHTPARWRAWIKRPRRQTCA